MERNNTQDICYIFSIIMEISSLYNKNRRSSPTLHVTQKLIQVFVDMTNLCIWYGASNSTSHMICNVLDFAQHLTQTFCVNQLFLRNIPLSAFFWCSLEIRYNQRAVISSLHNTKMSCILLSAVFSQPSSCYMIQGSTTLIFTCTDFHARKMVSYARLCTQNYVYINSHMGANLHRLVYNVLLDIVLPSYFAIS